MLREVADRQVPGIGACAAGRGKFAGEQLDQRRLACTVASQQRNTIAGIERQVDAAEQHALAVTGRLVFDGQQWAGQLGGLCKAEGEG